MAYVWARWIADALRAEGCKVKEEPGWQNRGRPASTGGFDPKGPELHHTGSTTSASNPAPTLRMCITGRNDLPGPLCAVVIGYDGTCHVIAAGRANHAGTSNGFGPYTPGDGNEDMVGFELDYNGTQNPSSVQKEAAVRAAAAVCRHFKRSAVWAVIHKETSVTGKWDTGQVSGPQWRRLIENQLDRRPDREDDDMPYSEWPEKDKKELASDVADALLARDLYADDPDKKVTVGKALRQSEAAAQETLK